MRAAAFESAQGTQHDAQITGSWRDLLYADIPRLLLFALAYLAACSYGTLFLQTAAAPLWLPDSVLLCALLLSPPKKWWLFIITAIPIRFIPTPHPLVPLWFLTANCVNDVLKATVEAVLLRRFTPALRLARLQEFAIYCGVSVFLVPALSAVAGATTRHLLGYGFWISAYQWFLGNSLAGLILTPALLYWYFQGFRSWRISKGELGLGTIGFILSLVVTLKLTHSSFLPVALCIPFPFLVWAAVRLRPVGTSTALFIIAMLSTAGLGQGTLFFMGFESKNLLFLQLFLLVISVPLLSLSILIDERSAVEEHLRKTQNELEENYEEVRCLAGKLISAQEDERRRIALELHDDLGQRIALMAAHLEMFRREASGASTRAHHYLRRIEEENEEIAVALRELSHQLHSSALHYLGLPAAIRGLGRTLSEQHVSIQMQVDDLPEISEDLKLCLFRIAQEALTNAIRHGKAEKVTIVLIRESAEIFLEISDNGTGFNPSGQSSGIGLIGMRERVRLVNGTISIDSKPTLGTTIIVRLPFVSQVSSLLRPTAG